VICENVTGALYCHIDLYGLSHHDPVIPTMCKVICETAKECGKYYPEQSQDVASPMWEQHKGQGTTTIQVEPGPLNHVHPLQLSCLPHLSAYCASLRLISPPHLHDHSNKGVVSSPCLFCWHGQTSGRTTWQGP
jgi:hypothetical protein